MFANDTPEQWILDYFEQFEQIVAPLMPRLIYLVAEDPASFLRHETLPRKGPDWVRKVTDYSAGTPHAMRRGLSGEDGLIGFWTAYRSLCDGLFRAWQFPRLRIENSRHDWTAIHAETGLWLDV